MNVQSSAGALSGTITADLQSPGQSVAGDVSVRHLNLAPILNDPIRRSDITADARLNVHGEALSNINTLHGTMSLKSPRVVVAGYTVGPLDARARIDGRRIGLDARAAAYGAAATASGHVTLPDTTKGTKGQPTVFDLRGQARHLDLRKLPRHLEVPPADTNVNADYHVVGSVASRIALKADLRFEPSTVAGAQIARGSTARLRMDGGSVGYSADATVSNLDLQRIGEEFRVPALANDHYKSTINGHVTVTGRETKLREMNVKASGSLADTAIMGGRIPRLNFDATLAHDLAHLKVDGTFEGFDPAVASGRPAMKGTVAGNLDIDASIARVSTGVTPDSVQARANVNLDPSTMGGLEITRATIDGDYHNSTGDIRKLEIAGRDLNVQASGTLALNDEGQSNLKLHADSPSLEEIGKLLNQPLSGIAKIDATITGNRRELQATGNVTGSGVKYGDIGALTVSTDYTAKVPELRAADASVTANTRATFVTVAGQNLNELVTKTSYQQKRMDFEATGKQPQRSLTAGGSLVLHSDHQEIHLRSLGLTSQGVQWQTAPNTEATVRYGGGSVEVKNLELVNGDQRIAANGTYGRVGDALQVTLNNIDIATVDALLLRPPQLTGRLNASATITAGPQVSGSSLAPQVQADFRIDQGGFKQFKYETFGGTVNYADRGLLIDSKLQQNAITWLTAKGYLPMALFRGASAEKSAAPGVAAARDDHIDFHIDSSPIDLGLIQGFTTAVTDVTGTLQAKIDVTGAADDPRPSGVITVKNGTFTVEPTNVSYTNLNGLVELQPDKVHIGAISVLDNHHNALNISGDLAIREREVGGVEIYVNADDFKVIDNKMGNVRIYSALEVTGELRAPRIEGDLGVTTGHLNLDPILAQFGDSPYSIQQTEFAAAPDAQAQGPAPSVFDALQMYVHLTVPNDLVVKAGDLAAPGAPIGLGALNVTLGGDLYASKSPYDRVRLIGAVNTVRGTCDFQGRRFTILRDGAVRFDGGDDFDPRLDLRTERVIQAVTARVNVRGTLRKPEIILSSTPPLEQADILSLIVFNQPINSVGEGQQISLAQRAQALATGAAAGQLATSIENALNLDTFEIQLAPETGGGPQLTVGQQVGQNLYVKVQQGIGDQSQTNFIVEYELARWLRLQTNVLQGSSTQQQLFQRMQGSGVDLLFFFSY